jgi:two-component system, NarL family, sensor histidine kinase DegS
VALQDADLLAQLGQARQALARQQQELDLQAEQMRGEVERESERFSQLRAKLDVLQQTLDRYSREELRDLFQAARDREMRVVVLRAELEGLEYKRAALSEQTRTLGRLSALVNEDASPPSGLPGDGAAIPAAQDDDRFQDSDLGALLLTQESDSRRLASRLHDRVAQPLHSMALQIELAQKWLATDAEKAAAELDEFRQLAAKALQDTRRVIFELRPMSLDDLGLLPTLERYVQVRAEQEPLVTRVQTEGRPRQLPSAIETTVFRILQAALDNVRDHAGVTEATVTLAFTDRELIVTIADEGRGCNMRLIMSTPGGSGLPGMKERARQIGGNVLFDSSPGRGMTVRLAVPLVGPLAAAMPGRRRLSRGS